MRKVDYSKDSIGKLIAENIETKLAKYIKPNFCAEFQLCISKVINNLNIVTFTRYHSDIAADLATQIFRSRNPFTFYLAKKINPSHQEIIFLIECVLYKFQQIDLIKDPVLYQIMINLEGDIEDINAMIDSLLKN